MPTRQQNSPDRKASPTPTSTQPSQPSTSSYLPQSAQQEFDQENEDLALARELQSSRSSTRGA